MEDDAQQLVQSFQHAGDDSSFEQLYDLHANLVFGYCLKMLGNYHDAEDAAQAIWVTVYFRLASFRGESSFKNWLMRIARNYCLNELRSRRPLENITEYEELIPQTQLQLHDQVQQKNDVTKLLSHVSLTVRTLLRSKYVDRRSHSQLAQEFGISESAVKMRIARAKQLLRRTKY